MKIEKTGLAQKIQFIPINEENTEYFLCTKKKLGTN